MKIKAGYKTSEFWFTMVSFIFSGLYLTGILTENEHKEELISVVSHAVESVILISGQVFILAKYIRGRSEIKKVAEQEKLAVDKTDSENTDDPKRTNTRPARKSNGRTKTTVKKPKKRGSK